MLRVLLHFVIIQLVSGQFNPACFYVYPVMTSGQAFCNDADQKLLVGDFDGSGRSDLLCRQNGSIEIFYNLLKRQKQPLDFCQNKNSQLTAADFNGDKKQDLLCRAKDGKMKVLLADETGKFKDSAENVKAIDTCDSKSYVGDFNGDGRADIFCRHSDGKVSLSRMNTKGTFDGTEPMEWDWCDKEDELHAGDFNGDGRTDLLCRSSNNKVSIALANSTGKFNGTWSREWDWCNQDGVYLIVTDFNGDGYDDLFCYNSNLHEKSSVAFNTPYLYFKNGMKYQFHFCTRGGIDRFFVGFFNDDKRADIVCQTAIGKPHIGFSHCA